MSPFCKVPASPFLDGGRPFGDTPSRALESGFAGLVPRLGPRLSLRMEEMLDIAREWCFRVGTGDAIVVALATFNLLSKACAKLVG